MDIKQRVGKNIRRLREQNGLTQEDLAHETELHRTYISGIERGVRNPTVVIIQRIADKLDVRPAELLE